MNPNMWSYSLKGHTSDIPTYTAQSPEQEGSECMHFRSFQSGGQVIQRAGQQISCCFTISFFIFCSEQ